MNVAVHGVALHEVSYRIGRRVHVVVVGGLLKSPSVGHGGGGGIGDVGVVAEGVETSVQLEQAQSLGFSTIQGWYYSRAVPLAECLQLSANRKPAVVPSDT